MLFLPGFRVYKAKFVKQKIVTKMFLKRYVFAAKIYAITTHTPPKPETY